MAECYARDAHFCDPIFTDLNGEEPGAMWRMLTGRAPDLQARLASSSSTADTGTANWIADYVVNGRHVHNDLVASFRFKDGLIIDHQDSFSFGMWARQALGPVGLLLGWTPLLRNQVQRQARAQLDRFLGRND
jgi:hypothetical protein